MHKTKLHIRLFFVLSIVVSSVFAQVGAPDSFRYQAIARDNTGAAIVSHSISVKVGIYSGSSTGVLVWEESHALVTDQNGLFLCLIGSGTSTGAGTLLSFSSIPWQINSYYLKISIDYSGGTTYTSMGSMQLVSVPYSFYSAKTEKADLWIDELTDVDTAGIAIGKILRWDGSQWRPSKENDDSVLFSSSSATANYAAASGSVLTAHHSIYSDTANYAISFLPYNWPVTGNLTKPSQFLGVRDSNDFVFSTSALERMRLTANGKLGIGNSSPIGQAHLIGNDGLLAIGTFGSGILADSSNNTKLLWFPQKAAVRMGQIASNRWNTDSIGNYSVAVGYNCQASGIYSFAAGYNCLAVNESCISMGKDCYTNSHGISLGGTIAMGDSCIITQTRSIAFGYKVINSGGIAMGYRTKVATSASTSAWGAYTTANSADDIAMGYYASSNAKNGCFVFADASSSSPTLNTANNQFMARASGGVIFYSDATLTNGVQLFPGGGAWASVSDSSKKENFNYENPEFVLQKIANLKILSWNYKSQNRKIRHVGPMAQDFYAAFLVGENNTSICTIDIDGVAMLGIKALEKRTAELSQKIDKLNELRSELKSIDNYSSIENRISKIEQALHTNK
jgi:hypothetical protein